jgi:hypothetical protein
MTSRNFYCKFGLLPVYGMYLTLLGQSALSKIADFGVPEWFLKQFSHTVLDAFPGALALNFFAIAALELVLTALFLVSLLRREFLPNHTRPFLKAGLWGSAWLFVALGFGLRMTGDFNSAAQAFVYFIVSFELFKYVARES